MDVLDFFEETAEVSSEDLKKNFYYFFSKYELFTMSGTKHKCHLVLHCRARSFRNSAVVQIQLAKNDNWLRAVCTCCNLKCIYRKSKTFLIPSPMCEASSVGRRSSNLRCFAGWASMATCPPRTSLNCLSSSGVPLKNSVRFWNLNHQIDGFVRQKWSDQLKKFASGH